MFRGPADVLLKKIRAWGLHPRKRIYNRKCNLRSPLGAVKNSLLLRHAHAKSTLFFSSNTWGNALAAVYTDILWFKVYTKGGSKLTPAYNKVHLHSTVVLYTR